MFVYFIETLQKYKNANLVGTLIDAYFTYVIIHHIKQNRIVFIHT